MTNLLPMQRFAEPLRMTGTHGDARGPAAGGKRRVGAQPLTPSTKGMLDGGEGTADARTRQPCTGPFAHGDQARRAQGSRGPGDQRDDALSPMSSTPESGIRLTSTKQLAAKQATRQKVAVYDPSNLSD